MKGFSAARLAGNFFAICRGKKLKFGITAALTAICLSACALDDLIVESSDLSDPESGVRFDYLASFSTFPSASVLMLVHTASTLLFFTDDPDGRTCFGLESPPVGKSLENFCLRFANVSEWQSDIWKPTPRSNPQFDHRVGASLVRDCGQHVLHSQDGLLTSGAGCGLFGAFLVGVGNIDAAKAVWEQAPGCHTHDVFGDPMNGCMRFIVGQGNSDNEGQQWLGSNGYDHRKWYDADKPKLIAMAKAACLNEYDYASCAFLKESIGADIDMVAFARAVKDRNDAAIAFLSSQNTQYSNSPFDRWQAEADRLARNTPEAKQKEAESHRVRSERNARFKALVSPLLSLG